MGTLLHRGTKKKRPIPARLVIGRSATCGLRLDDALASNEHAVMTWTGTHWTIKDLGSSNGTYVDGTLLRTGTTQSVGSGTTLAFGDQGAQWELLDEDAPVAMATHLGTNVVRAAPDGLLVLPDDDHPEVTIYESSTGDWIEERSDGTSKAIGEESMITVDGAPWLVQLPGIVEGTPQARATMGLHTVTLEFAVSRNEETVEITVLDGPVSVRLETRDHAYVLLTLARARREDSDLEPDERGWRDRADLERMLRMDSNALNVAIHRARKQLRAIDVIDAGNIVEVRRGQRRIGTDRFRIVELPG